MQPDDLDRAKAPGGAQAASRAEASAAPADQLPMSPYKGRSGLIRIWNALFYSLAGLKAAYRHEDAFRQEVWLAVVLIPLALYLSEQPIERALMIGSVLLVLIVELINSAIEATVDRISLKDHVLARRAKDIGSASVFVALINVVVIWVLILMR